ncbi:MFS transporter [Actinomadura soli]|uniref:hypothetical protein n=1 Tax=Actinomadura soli TaxID=2508997 RepID=UPI00197ABDBC|nr:hypothetical protein [Actinomadura soli]
MLAAGLWTAPAGLVMMAVSPLGARLSRARGPKVTLCAGVGLAYGAMPALIMSAVPQSETGAANSFNTVMRSVGTSVSAAVVGVVLAQMTIDLGGHALPSEDGFHVGMLIAGGSALIAAAVTLALPSAGARRTAAGTVRVEAPGAVTGTTRRTSPCPRGSR